MTSLAIALSFFVAGYLINVFYITVLYHRGLAHQSVKLSPFSMKIIEKTGNWVTGIDPKAWAAMHRMHHQYSDTDKDPHSPLYYGVFGVAMGQLKSYQNVLRKLLKKEPKLTRLVQDIPFGVSSLNAKKLWILPYLLHVGLGIVFAILFHSPLVGAAYFLGIMSHPVQGWMVNSLAHKYGYRNFNEPDNSKNNMFVGLVVFGEGFQNNHHAFPGRANFAHRFFEVDLGYALCVVASRLGFLTLKPASEAEALEKTGT